MCHLVLSLFVSHFCLTGLFFRDPLVSIASPDVCLGNLWEFLGIFTVAEKYDV